MTTIQYIRVSSEEQAKDGHAGTQKLKLDIKHLFRDTETAKTAGRENFRKMLDFIRASKKPVILLVEKTDRLYRNMEEHLILTSLMTSKGLQIREKFSTVTLPVTKSSCIDSSISSPKTLSRISLRRSRKASIRKSKPESESSKLKPPRSIFYSWLGK
jgi:hypothetical protein